MAEPEIIKKEEKETKKAKEVTVSTPDPMEVYMRSPAVLCVTPTDLWIWEAADGIIIAPVDARNQPVLNCTLNLTNSFMERLVSAYEKKKEKKTKE